MFTEEIRALKNLEDLPTKNKQQLSPFFDDNTGFIIVGGKMHKASLPEETKNSVILPRQHYYVDLLIQDIHERQLYAGNNQSYNIKISVSVAHTR